MKRIVQALPTVAALGLASGTCVQVTCPNGMYAIDTPTGRQYHCAVPTPAPSATPAQSHVLTDIARRHPGAGHPPTGGTTQP